MGDQPSYSDPIIIPITITIPDPRPKTATGRWGQLGRSIHPSVDDPGWFQRQDPAAALGAIQASATQRRFDDPPVTLLPDPPPSRLQEKLDEMISRAERRAAYARKEIEQREYGSAAGHLLLGRPFPADVDDTLPQIVQNEAQEGEEEGPHPGRSASDAKTNAATEDKPPSTPTGQRGLTIEVAPGTNQPAEIGGRLYTGHALDRMQGRGIPPSAIEQAIQSGQTAPGNRPGTTVHIGDRVVVVTGSGGQVVTVRHR